MGENAESGIASVQAKAAQSEGLQKHHKTTISYLNERIVTFVCIISILGLVVVWMTSPSPWVTYGTVLIAIVAAVLWGMLRIKRIHQVREQRQQQARDWKPES